MEASRSEVVEGWRRWVPSLITTPGEEDVRERRGPLESWLVQPRVSDTDGSILDVTSIPQSHTRAQEERKKERERFLLPAPSLVTSSALSFARKAIGWATSITFKLLPRRPTENLWIKCEWTCQEKGGGRRKNHNESHYFLAMNSVSSHIQFLFRHCVTHNFFKVSNDVLLSPHVFFHPRRCRRPPHTHFSNVTKSIFSREREKNPLFCVCVKGFTGFIRRPRGEW